MSRDYRESRFFFILDEFIYHFVVLTFKNFVKNYSSFLKKYQHFYNVTYCDTYHNVCINLQRKKIQVYSESWKRVYSCKEGIFRLMIFRFREPWVKSVQQQVAYLEYNTLTLYRDASEDCFILCPQLFVIV